MEQKKEYYAFISYKSEDAEWAIWLQHELEHYHLPALFNGRMDVPQELRPVFRDIDELSAGNLPEQIKRALENSQNLIVICSPQSATSPWVNQEVETFISLGKTNRIFPFIVEGNSPKDFFPPALLSLPSKEERLGGEVSKSGRDAAFVKIVAGMLNLDFDTLWNRYEKEKAEEERKQREQREKLLVAQSRFVAEKAISILEDDSYLARLLLLEVLPTDVKRPNRPLVPEAEKGFREACIKNNAVLKGHSKTVFSVNFDTDDAKIVSTSLDRTIRIWEVFTGKCLRVLVGHTDYVISAVFVNDNKTIASISKDNTVRIWDINTGECLHVHVIKGNIHTASFCVNNSKIIFLHRNGGICLLDIYTWESKFLIKVDNLIVDSIKYNDKQKLILIVSFNTIYLFDINSRKCVYRLNGHSIRITDANFSTDGNKIVSTSFDKTIRVWDTQTGVCLYTMSGHSNTIGSVQFSRDCSKIVSASDDKTIRLWDTKTGECLQIFDIHKSIVWTAQFSNNGIFIVSASDDKTICIKNIETDVDCIKILKGHEKEVYSAIFSSNGKKIVTASGDKSVRIWDSETGSCLQILNGHTKDVIYATFSYDCKRIVSVSEDNTIRIWDSMTGNNIQVLTGHTKTVYSVICCSDDRTIITASADNTIRIWNSENGNCIRILEGHTDYVNSIAYSHNNQIIVSASGDHTIRFWNLETGNCIRIIECDVRNVGFSPNGSSIVSVMKDDTICIWDVETGDCIQTINDYMFSLNYAAFNYNGEKIISASGVPIDILSPEDNTIRIWDVQTGCCIWCRKAHVNGVTSANFSPDGKRFVSSSYDGLVKVWSFPELQDLIDETRQRFKERPLTSVERLNYYLE